jgi:hypothetical protein
MAPPFSLHSHPKMRKKFMAVYLVRSFRTYARIRSLTTGTFNLVVKDRIAVHRSGANSVQANPHECESDCPRNPSNIRCCANPVNLHIPQHLHMFSTCESTRMGSEIRGASLVTARNGMAFRFDCVIEPKR